MVEQDREDAGDRLSEHGCPCGACRAEPEPAQPEGQLLQNEDRVKHDVEDRADTLRIHGVDGLAGGLHQPLKHDLEEDEQRKDRADAQICNAAFLDGGEVQPRVKLCRAENAVEIQIAAEQSENEDDNIADEREQHTVFGDAVGAHRVFLTERL